MAAKPGVSLSANRLRLDALLSRFGYCSRSEARAWVKAGRILVAGVPAKSPSDKAAPANVDLQERNAATAWGRQVSEKMDFSKEDAADDLLLNEVVWRSVRGADSPMPAPTRAAFVFVRSEKDEDDD